jgi:hypothetical protein
MKLMLLIIILFYFILFYFILFIYLFIETDKKADKFFMV